MMQAYTDKGGAFGKKWVLYSDRGEEEFFGMTRPLCVFNVDGTKDTFRIVSEMTLH